MNLQGHVFNGHGLGQRGIGDILEDTVKRHYQEESKNLGHIWRDAPSVRSIEDFSVESDRLVLYDVKTTDLDRNFSMPNLISVKRLIKLYSNPKAELCYCLVSYRENNDMKEVVKYEERLIESISWDCLTIQNLGEGQIQLLTSSNVKQFEGTRQEWIEELKRRVLIFLDETISKMNKRKEFWSK
jgi:hypothetical protein